MVEFIYYDWMFYDFQPSAGQSTLTREAPNIFYVTIKFSSSLCAE